MQTPCVASPGTGLIHIDGPCQCFFGGAPPIFGPSNGVKPRVSVVPTQRSSVSIEQMRKAVSSAYPGADWPYKVMKMPDKQVHSVYTRLMNSNKL